jgi:hypothetical protein
MGFEGLAIKATKSRFLGTLSGTFFAQRFNHGKDPFALFLKFFFFYRKKDQLLTQPLLTLAILKPKCILNNSSSPLKIIPFLKFPVFLILLTEPGDIISSLVS